MAAFTHRRNLDFLLFEMFGIDQKFEQDRETVNAVFDTAQTIAETHFLPIAAELDANEPKMVDGKVQIPSKAKDALRHFAEAGLVAMPFSEEDGGLEMPYTVSLMVAGIVGASNISLLNYPFLTGANANVIATFGTPDQKARFLPPMLDGRWFGTMCLSEPQAGSSLSDITTRAVPDNEGGYHLSGSKMWISGGDHELSDNIVHLVLAKIPGGPSGVKGMSLFLVPRYRVNPDGTKGDWNNVELGGLNHKMGQRGTTNCLLNFGEKGACVGEIIGEPGKGLAYMFQMMNEARIMVGMCATTMGTAGFLYSLEYAKERPQGRHPQNKDPESPQVPIIEHADVRRMLLAQKASAEGAMSLVAYAATLVDELERTQDEAEKAELNLLLELLTPIVKSWPSEHCLDANKQAIQILGGYGYTREFPVERLYRDNRLNPIHEGAYGIHGIDLLGRKVRIKDGAAMRIFAERVRATIAGARQVSGLKAEADALEAALTLLQDTTQKIIACQDLNLGLSLATLYLDAFGHVTIAWQWLWQAIIATGAREGAHDTNVDFYDGKLAACRYFFRFELPKAHAQFDLVGRLDDTCMEIRPEQFA